MITYYKDCGDFEQAQIFGGQRSRLGHNVLYYNNRVYFSAGPVIIKDATNVKDLDVPK